MEMDIKTVGTALDIVGDVHGCIDELIELLTALGYRVEPGAVTPPEGRTLAFVGDLVNRGPNSAEVLRLTMSMMQAGQAVCVAGNHEMRLLRALRGESAVPREDVARTVMQLDAEGIKFRGDVVDFLQKLPSLLLMDAGALVLTHAGLKTPSVDGEALAPRDVDVLSESNGKRDKSGQSPRVNWAAAYRGQALVAYGHTPVAEPTWLNRTVNIDTGCVYGGHLTALRYPELETVRIAARQIYYPSRRRFLLNPKLLSNRSLNT